MGSPSSIFFILIEGFLSDRNGLYKNSLCNMEARGPVEKIVQNGRKSALAGGSCR